MACSISADSENVRWVENDYSISGFEFDLLNRLVIVLRNPLRFSTMLRQLLVKFLHELRQILPRRFRFLSLA